MNRITLFTAAALAMGAIGVVGCNKTDTAQDTSKSTDNRTAGEKTKDAINNAGQAVGNAAGTAVDKTGQAAQTAGDKIKNAAQPSADSAMKDTRDTLRNVVENALNKNNLGDVVDNFTKADRDRIGKIDKNSLGDLNTAIDSFTGAWKAKYNQDFKLSDKEQVVFGTPVEIKVGDQGDNARLASDKAAPTGTNTNANDKSANNATSVSFPAAHGAPAVNLHLVNEGTVTNSFKIDAPDSLDANKLRDNLVKHINEVTGMKDQWPSDPNEAYRTVAHHVLAAISDAK
jgi:hypothetical protein